MFPPLAPSITSAQVNEAVYRAHRLRARAFRLFGKLVRRAVRRAATRTAHWLRHRLDEPPPISPWMHHRL